MKALPSSARYPHGSHVSPGLPIEKPLTSRRLFRDGSSETLLAARRVSRRAPILGSDGALLGVHPVCGLLGFARCGEDRALILAQYLESRRNVAGVICTGFDAEGQVPTNQGAQKLNDAFLHGVGFGAKPAGEITIKTVFGT